MRVLVVDDEPLQRLTLTARLTVIGLDAEALEDAEQAATLCAANRYGIVFMDFDMPTLNGFDATRRIRETLARRNLPQPLIVGFSADPDGDRRVRAAEAGMEIVVDKFIPAQRLHEIIGWATQRECGVDRRLSPQSATEKDGKHRMQHAG